RLRSTCEGSRAPQGSALRRAGELRERAHSGRAGLRVRRPDRFRASVRGSIEPLPGATRRPGLPRRPGRARPSEVAGSARPPPAAGGRATGRFGRPPDGALSKGRAAGAPSCPLAVSGGAALFEAAPFPPLAGEARCAAGPLLALTLAVPANQASSPDEAPGRVR